MRLISNYKCHYICTSIPTYSAVVLNWGNFSSPVEERENLAISGNILGPLKWRMLLASSGSSPVQFSHSVVSDPLQHHEPQHARTLVQYQLLEFTQTHVHWAGDAIQPSHPLSSPSPPALELGSFPMSQQFASGGQSIGASASTLVLPMNTQDWSPLGWTGWISLQFKGPSRVLSTPQFKSINSSALSFLYSPTLTSIHDYWKNHSLD